MFKKIFLVAMILGSQLIASEQNYETIVDLTNTNFKIIETNVVGKSFGVFVLIAGSTSNKAAAVKSLMSKAKITPGSRRCLINLNVERRTIFFIVGALTIDIARADVIEILDDEIKR